MVITRITKENELKFNYLFPREAWAHDSDLIRLGAIDDEGKGVAALSARVEGRNIRIISLFVLEGHRRRGIGRMMVKWLETFLLDQEIDVLLHGRKASKIQIEYGLDDRPQATITNTSKYGIRCT